jgi:cation diffusion facilitator family transporter
MSAPDSRKAVLAALLVNVAIAACKFGAAFLSRSTATLAEAVHSLADTGNQLLLLVGMRLALRPADERFPFGRASERYFWPFVVALMLFSVGGAFAVFEGATKLVEGDHGGERSPVWSYAVLGVSLVLEAVSFRVAWGEMRKHARGQSLVQTILTTRDPTLPLVIAEDTTALVGLVLALVAVALTQLTGSTAFDAIGSILIGGLLAVVALVIARITHGLLIGESASPEDQARALVLAESTAGVEGVTQLLTMHLGPDVVILAMKLAFREGMTARDIEKVTNDVESRIRKELPQMRKIFIEVDAHGDGRGVEAIRDRVEQLGATASGTKAGSGGRDLAASATGGSGGRDRASPGTKEAR